MADKKEITAYTIMNKLYKLGYKCIFGSNDRHGYRKEQYMVFINHEPLFLHDDYHPALEIYCGNQRMVTTYVDDGFIMFPKMPIEALYKIIESGDDLLTGVREYFVDKDLEVLDD